MQVQWSAEGAAASALAQITSAEGLVGRALAVPKILSVAAWAGKDVPPEFGEGDLSGWPVVWIVQAEGTFVSFSCPVAPCPNDSSGYFLFDDSGQVIGSGFPLPQPSN